MRLERRVIQQKSEAQNLESYTAMISHEFRTPLATALMFIDIIIHIIMTLPGFINLIRLLDIFYSTVS